MPSSVEFAQSQEAHPNNLAMLKPAQHVIVLLCRYIMIDLSHSCSVIFGVQIKLGSGANISLARRCSRRGTYSSAHDQYPKAINALEAEFGRRACQMLYEIDTQFRDVLNSFMFLNFFFEKIYT